jgi:hypothetical protein
MGITMERVMGIEPTYLAWKANVLPLNYTRSSPPQPLVAASFNLVEGGGFEPPKLKTADLQSAPVGRLGIPPTSKARHFRRISAESQQKIRVISIAFPAPFSVSEQVANYRHIEPKYKHFFQPFQQPMKLS